MNHDDAYLGLQPKPGYVLTDRKKSGKTGTVYRAENSELGLVRACKVVKAGKLKQGWQRELEKVSRLSGIDGVVQYHDHGKGTDNRNRAYSWVLFDWIDGSDLREYLADAETTIDMAFIEGFIRRLLDVLFACRAENIEHGDLHEGNIMVRSPDPRKNDAREEIWVTDFGYGGSHNRIDPKDDLRQLHSISMKLLARLDPRSLNARDRNVHVASVGFVRRDILEQDPTQGAAGDIGRLIGEFNDVVRRAEQDAAAARSGGTTPGTGDYLAAEMLGNRVEEWKQLFVPNVLAARNLLSPNITVLTGARGCGKTMVFRRLTEFMNTLVGEPSGVPGSDAFHGFYLNCRDLVEAFPWHPKNLTPTMKDHFVTYFHLAWLSEIVRTLMQHSGSADEDFGWFEDLLVRKFAGKFRPAANRRSVLPHVSAFIEGEKELCRNTPLKHHPKGGKWSLSSLDLLDEVTSLMHQNVSWVDPRKPIFLFLDDYTVPIVRRQVQETLNPIVFKRRPMMYFKVSTESTISFVPVGFGGKPLEVNHDFDLIDLATESLRQTDMQNESTLDSIFRPRLRRHDLLNQQNVGLRDVLGTMDQSHNDLARLIRSNVQEGSRRQVRYFGAEAFVGMWTSDVRSMIQMMSEMLDESRERLVAGDISVPKDIQHRTFHSTGGRFLTLIGSMVDPDRMDHGVTDSTKVGQPYGEHLKDIAEAFAKVSRHEMTKGPLVGNQKTQAPKQAFRLEVIDKFELPDEAMKYYRGLIRWHVFLQDWRGRSVRGYLTPRIYLNRLLIPVSGLTFSSHDNINMTSDELARLMTAPEGFVDYWRRKKPQDDGTVQAELHFEEE